MAAAAVEKRVSLPLRHCRNRLLPSALLAAAMAREGVRAKKNGYTFISCGWTTGIVKKVKIKKTPTKYIYIGGISAYSFSCVCGWPLCFALFFFLLPI